MKKLLIILILFLIFVQPIYATEELESWVSDIKSNNGHVTYTFNAYFPLDNDTIHFKNRRDYICSQQIEAILWGEATYLSTGRTIDYSFMMDKTRLRKYVPIKREDYSMIQQHIIPYCKQEN